MGTAKEAFIRPKVIAALLATFMTSQTLCYAAPPSVSLDQAVSTLENSGSRAEVLQSMADLYEVAGTKTLLARTKFKYVMNYFSSEFQYV